MVGRSNVGKSTLINALVRQKLARTSAAPGKTRLASFYRVAVEGRPAFYLVDLPGYGYARGGDKTRDEFDALAAEYFGNRAQLGSGGRDEPSAFAPGALADKSGSSNLKGVIALVDSRHPGLDSDRSAWNWLGRSGVNRLVVATKLDKLTRAERQRHLTELERIYSGPVAPVSAQTGEGLDELWKTIQRLLTPP